MAGGIFVIFRNPSQSLQKTPSIIFSPTLFKLWELKWVSECLTDMALQLMSAFLPCSYNSFPPLRAPFWRHSLSFRASSHNLSEASSCEGGLTLPHSPSTDISALKILLDQELASGNERRALDLIASSGLRGFGTASQVLTSHCLQTLYSSPHSRFLSFWDLYVCIYVCMYVCMYVFALHKIAICLDRN